MILWKRLMWTTVGRLITASSLQRRSISTSWRGKSILWLRFSTLTKTEVVT
uniref:Uncharacterized protein n=1 Tax=Brassica oleracea TaxID=3712 RepID=A0A3P6F1B1_BRAOL|nr:unnamed protein product [Brassica oleracea]